MSFGFAKATGMAGKNKSRPKRKAVRRNAASARTGSPSKPADRSWLFEELSEGRLSPDEAEQQASELGLGPLNPPLDPEQYDPMHLTHWTLPMAVAWISWRDMERVREVSPDWRKDALGWRWRDYRLSGDDGQPRDISGWYLEREYHDTPALLFLSLSEAVEVSEGTGDDTRQFSIAEARRALWQALADGDLDATTLENGRIHPIAAAEWGWLETGEDGGKDVLYVRDSGVLLPRYPHPVLLSRRAVILQWPTPAERMQPQKDMAAIIQEAAAALQVTPAWRATRRVAEIQKWITENYRHVSPAPGKTKIGEALRSTPHVRARSPRRAGR
jgi:hypothetical protein